MNDRERRELEGTLEEYSVEELGLILAEIRDLKKV